jgi:hypothetical protein
MSGNIVGETRIKNAALGVNDTAKIVVKTAVGGEESKVPPS